MRPLRIGKEKRRRRRKIETAGRKFNGLPYWAAITMGTVQKISVCHHGDRSSRCADMAIFGFVKMASVRHLGF